MGDFEILVSTPDLLTLVPEENSFWLPVARDFMAIQNKYGNNPIDFAALRGWAELKRHARFLGMRRLIFSLRAQRFSIRL